MRRFESCRGRSPAVSLLGSDRREYRHTRAGSSLTESRFLSLLRIGHDRPALDVPEPKEAASSDGPFNATRRTARGGCHSPCTPFLAEKRLQQVDEESRNRSTCRETNGTKVDGCVSSDLDLHVDEVVMK